MTDRPVLHLSLPVDDLHAARSFYEHTLGCRIGREREDWFDAWFYWSLLVFLAYFSLFLLVFTGLFSLL